jgi:uncharacterized membrane protein (DUF485 family)
MSQGWARPRPEGRTQKSAHEVISSPDFKALVAKRWTVSTVLLVLLFVTYYGYVLLIPYARGFMVARVGATTTRAIPVGLAVIAISFVLTWVYVGWANQSYDPEVDRLKNQLKK